MKSSENTSLVYIFQEKIWLSMNDVSVCTILWSFFSTIKTLQICQKYKEGKYCSISAKIWYDTIYFIFLMWSVRDLKSPLIYKSPCKKIENIQKSRTEATKTFWVNVHTLQSWLSFTHMAQLLQLLRFSITYSKIRMKGPDSAFLERSTHELSSLTYWVKSRVK